MALLLAAVLALAPVQAARIDAVAHAVMRDRGIGALSLGIARRGTPLYLRGYGFRDAAHRHAADAYTIYRAGSITKQFTAALLLQEVAAGRVVLRGRIEQLLGQTSGLPTGAPPGSQWQYSNENYRLASMVLQQTTGLDFGASIATRIAGPLRLPSTAYGLPPDAVNVADGDPGPAIPGATGLASNAPDLIRWLEALRRGRVVPPALFAAMTTSGRLGDGTLTHYGLGFFIDDWYGYRVAYHTGFTGDFSSEDALLDDGLEIAVLTDRAAVDPTPLVKSIVAILDPPRDPNAYARPSQPPQNEDPKITAGVTSIASAAAFAPLGALRSVEFVERTNHDGDTFDKYRVTFATGAWWMTVGYGAGGAIESLTMLPVR